MTTVATLPSSTEIPDGPTEPTIEQIDAGFDDDLVDAAFEDLDDDPVVASLQADRDRLAARGDMDTARAHHQRVQEMRATQAVADRAAAALDELGQIDADREIELPGGLPPEEPMEPTGPRSSDAREMRDLSWAAAGEPGEATYARRADARHWEATARVLDELDASVTEPGRLAQVREWEQAYLASDDERLAELGEQLWPDAPSLDDRTPYVEDTGPEVQA